MAWHTGLEHVVRQDEPLAHKCWLKTGGPAEFFVEPTTIEELCTVVQRAHENDLPIRVLGGGSNLLIREVGVKGIVLRLNAPAFHTIAVDERQITAGGGTPLTHVIASAAGQGLSGLEPLVGIPGTIGGALHGNSGDRVTDVGNWVSSVTVLTRTGEMKTHQRNDMNFSYRSSSVDELAILSATFQLEPDNESDLTRRLQKNWIVKRAQQPQIESQTCQLFKDPLGMTASELIHQAGMRSQTHGGAALFERDANFVVLTGNASSADVLGLIDTIRENVSSSLNVDLEPALQIW